MTRYRPGMRPSEWLLPRIRLKADTNCWLWQGQLDAHGYGRTSTGYAHRHVWRLFGFYIGPRETGEVLHHRCAVRHCVNPDHLEIRDRGEHIREHQAPRKVDPAIRRARRVVYMRTYLPAWRAKRKARVLSGKPGRSKNARQGSA